MFAKLGKNGALKKYAFFWFEINAECFFFFCIGKPSCYRFSSFLVAGHFLYTVFVLFLSACVFQFPGFI